MMVRGSIRLMLLGLALLLAGATLPFLMVIRVLDASFVLSFFAYGTSVVGIALGLIGIARHGHSSRHGGD